MKVPIEFLALGVKTERIIGSHIEREGGKSPGLPFAEGALPHIVGRRGGKDVAFALSPPRGEVDVTVDAADVRLPHGEIFAAVEGEKKFAAFGAPDGGNALFHEQCAVGICERHQEDGADGRALEVLERQKCGDVLPRVDGVDGDADGAALPHAERKEGTALVASADDAFFSRVGCIGGADAAIDVHSAWYAFAAAWCAAARSFVIFRAA